MLRKRLGLGFDLHRLSKESTQPIFLGGVELPSPYGMVAHSDGDVLFHAVIDALLAAYGLLEDIGSLFPPTEANRGRRSSTMLREVIERYGKEFSIDQICAVILCDGIRLSPFRKAMIDNLYLLTKAKAISIAFKTWEQMFRSSKEQWIAAQVVVSIDKRRRFKLL